MSNQSFGVIVLVVLLFSVIHRQQVSGHGSHQHMRNQHQHYFPKVDEKSSSGKVDSVLQEKKMMQDRDHLVEDLKGVYTEEQIAKMTPAELEFHYFKLHDYDNNDQLDGTEIMAAISHIMPHDEDLDLARLGEGHILTLDEKRRLQEAKQRRDDQLNLFIKMIDQMFVENDVNKDGFINYQEFIKTRR